MRHVVLDEADLLLTGGFQRDVRRILDALREGDRAQRSSAVARQLGLSGDALAALPRHLRKAAAQGKTRILCAILSCTHCCGELL
jgi:superfamily II DNA/RNA helicase